MNHESLCLKCFIKKKQNESLHFPKGVVQRKGTLSPASHLASQGRCPDRQSLLACSVKFLPTSLHCSSLFSLISVILNLQRKNLKKVKHCTPKPNAIHIKVQRGPGSGQLNLPSYLITGHFLIKPTRVHTPLLTMGLHFRKQFGIWRARGG